MEPITIDKTMELTDMLYESEGDYDRALYLSYELTNVVNGMITLGATDEQINEIMHSVMNRNRPETLLS